MSLASHVEDRILFLLDNLNPQRKTCIVDIGANPLDKPPYADLFALGGCEVWGFEPAPIAFEKLQNNLREGEKYLPYAIGNGSDQTLNIYNASGLTSLFSLNPLIKENIWHIKKKSTKLEAQLTIQTRRLDSLSDLPTFDLLKIDIQGSEVSVFEGGPKKISQAVAVITEVAAIPLYTNQPLLDQQMQSLRSLGFNLHKFLHFKKIRRRSPTTDGFGHAQHSNQLLDGDAVFLRGFIDFSELDNQELRHQAILADSTYHSYDFALQLVEELVRREEIPRSVLETYSQLLNPTTN